MIGISVHEAMSVYQELPWNNWCLCLKSTEGAEITFYCRDAQEWFRLRSVFPKHDSYYFSPSDASFDVRDHAEADRMAADILAALTAQVEAA